MNLLAAKLYDPAGAVTKATSALLAMTALDTTNLRLAITVPAHGMIRVRMAGVVHGATTFPSILLGVMNGSTILGRVAPVQSLGNTAVATALVNVEADFIVTGLTPGAMNVDAAYGVETIIASTGLKYGGPNDATANNAFGGFVFEIYDPKPAPANFSLLGINSSGHVSRVVLADTLTAYTGNTPQTGDAFNRIGVAGAGLTAIGDTRIANLDATVSSRLATASYTTPPTAVAIRTEIDSNSAGLLAIFNRTDVATSSRLADSSYVPPPSAAANGVAVRSELATELGRMDVAVSTRLATAGYTAPDNSGIVNIQAVTDKLGTMYELDGAVYRFTTNALEQGPGGIGSDSWASIGETGISYGNLFRTAMAFIQGTSIWDSKTEEVVWYAPDGVTERARTKTLNGVRIQSTLTGSP